MNIKSNLQNTVSDPKSRVFFFLMIAVIAVVLLFAFISRNSAPVTDASGSKPKSNIINPGAGLQSTPGVGQTSEEYQELQRQNEEQQAQAALENTGQPSAALPALQLGSQSNAIPGFNVDKPTAYNDRLNEELDNQRIRQQDALQRQQQQLESAQLDAKNKQIQALLARQTQLLAQNWQVIRQEYIEGSIKEFPRVDLVKVLKETRDEEIKSEKPRIYYKAGDILFGVLLTAVNSDEPGPVLARVISGPLSNSKIIGSINPASIPKSAKAARVSTSLILEFNLMNIPGSKQSVVVRGVAIDPQTARTSLATSVNHHYMLRYGTTFAAAFLAGLGQAVSTQNQSRLITDFGTTVNVGSNKLSGSDELKIAFGKTAETLSDRMDLLDTPPTIKVSSGTAIGILLQEDLVIGENDQVDTRSIIGNNGRTVITNAVTYQQSPTDRQMNNVYGATTGQTVTAP